MLSSALVSLFASRLTQKNIQPIFIKFGGKVADGPRKKPLGLDFGGNPELWYAQCYSQGHRHIPQERIVLAGVFAMV